MRNMSFALTIPQMQARTKDVTRRMGWEFLKVGDLLQPVRKCMGLKPGERIERICGPIRVVSKERQRLDEMLRNATYGFAEIQREGFAEHPVHCWPSTWVEMFCNSHKGCKPETVITRIEFKFED